MQKNKKIFSFLGLPASGKGTQAQKFAERQNLKLIAIGDLIREHLDDKESIKRAYDKGVPQPDEIVFELLAKTIPEIEGGIVFDNFPFSREQADWLFDSIEDFGLDNPVLINLETKPETSFKRITTRKICPKCHKIFKGDIDTCDECGEKLEQREDDNAKTLATRVDFYLPRIEAVEKQFKSKNYKVITIDGEQSISGVENEIATKIG